MMFRPSGSLLFRPMPTINKFKIHPPLPLNPRESKQLLNLLTSSFRQQLDAEHGGFRTTSKFSTPQKDEEKLKKRRRSSFDSKPRPTDQHMNSILTNPLFTLAADEKATTERDPMEVFDLAVAKGMMNLNYAMACLNAKKHEIIRSSVPTIRKGMQDSGAGLKVLKWLVSSGTANNNDFLRNPRFTQTLMEYLVAEGLQEVCWKWIQRSFQLIPRYFATYGHGHGPNDPNTLLQKELRKEIVGPLYHLVMAEAAGDASLDSAYICMSRAVGYLTGHPKGRLRDLLRTPGSFLVNETVRLHSERPSPSVSAFDSFFSLIPVLSKLPSYQLAHLSLMHPSKPSADLAMDFLRTLETMDPEAMPAKAFNYTSLGLATAKFLLESERYEDAEWVMNFLRRNYSRQLGISQTDQLEQVRSEAASMQLLEGLSLV